ncbi:MAG: 23S rRNA (guanosine(2251)-2'-O)-methyltransferase RlmB [Candidatus Binatia bacterium]
MLPLVVSEKNIFFIFGVHPVMEKLMGSPQEVVEVLIARGRQRAAIRSIQEMARRRGLPIYHLESSVLDRLVSGGGHQGVVAKVLSHIYCDFAELLGRLVHLAGDRWILVLDGVTDPRNFGSLLRTAEGMGIRDVVVPRDRSVGVTPTVAKTSAGAVAYLKIYRVTNLRRAISELKERGYWVVGLDAQAKEEVYSRSYPERLVVVLGGEGSGIRPLIRGECDFLVSIPMQGRIASLNVGVSGGMFLYELVRQKASSKRRGVRGFSEGCYGE